ncbi:hypothetical protein GC175_16850 [bacterium]|nr:hypothetical protein [bacterium]
MDQLLGSAETFRRLCLLLALLAIFSAWQPAIPILAQSGSGITSPAPGSGVGGPVPVIGTAAIDSFQRYELYYKQEPNGDDAYIYFDGDTRQVTNGQLGVWQTGDLAPGTYTIRLRVVKADGNYSEHFAPNLNVNLQPPTPTPTSTPEEEENTGPTPTPIPIDTPTPVPQPTPAVVEVQQPNIGGGAAQSGQTGVEPSPTPALVALGQEPAPVTAAQNTTGQTSVTAGFTQELGAAVAIDRLRERFMTGVRYSAGIFLIVFAIFAGKRLLEWTISRAG